MPKKAGARTEILYVRIQPEGHDWLRKQSEESGLSIAECTDAVIIAAARSGAKVRGTMLVDGE
jgi:hypothetical protein